MIWVARYLLLRVAEKFGVFEIEFHPKPVKGDLEWLRMHTIFRILEWERRREKSTSNLILAKLEKRTLGTIFSNYGSMKSMSDLQGCMKLKQWNKFLMLLSDRGAFEFVSFFHVKMDGKGYLEDRRPASNGLSLLGLQRWFWKSQCYRRFGFIIDKVEKRFGFWQASFSPILLNWRYLMITTTQLDKYGSWFTFLRFAIHWFGRRK